MTSQDRAPGGVDRETVSWELAAMLEALAEDPALRSLTRYVPGGVVRLTRRFKPSRRDRRTELLLTFGEPNYHERQVAQRAKKRGETPPEELRSYRAWRKPA